MRYLIVLLLFSSSALADVTYTWTAPTAREDGSPLAASEIAGYRLEWTLKGVAQPPVTVPSVLSHLLVSAPGRVCATIVTIDTDGLESVPTPARCKNSRPGMPGNFGAK